LLEGLFQLSKSQAASQAAVPQPVRSTLSLHTAAVATLTAAHRNPVHVEDVLQQPHKQQCQRSVVAPLDKDEILDTVFSYVGIGEYFTAAGVSRRWRGRYIKLCYNKAANRPNKLCTTYRSAVLTAAKLQLALANKLTVEALERSLRSRSCMVLSSEPTEVLTVARLHGMAWHKGLCLLAAKHNNLQLLQWLHSNGCPWSLNDVAAAAACADSADMLNWLHSVEDTS
jgi:hypothetical protein